MPLQLIIVEAEDEARSSLCRHSEESGWTVSIYSSVDELVRAKHEKGASILIFSIPESQSETELKSDTENLGKWRRQNPRVQLLLMLPRGYQAADKLALEIGARHVLYKPYEQKDLAHILAQSAQGIGKREVLEAIETRLKKPQGFEEIIGTSDSIRKVIELAGKVALSDWTSVMIMGENGTGKGAFAKAIHQTGNRSAGPFIEVNCAAIPRNLLESEFFGYEKGAFTDAKNQKIGLFECANGGSIFLDEVGEIDYSLQAKLLKFLDTRMIRRLSGTKFLPVDVRVISATNRNLRLDVEQHRFRADLFYRLAVVEIVIPPLREHVEDIRPIAEMYTERFASRLNKGRISLTEEAVDALERYSWPGNIRELINIMERAVLLNTSGKIEPNDLPIMNEQPETTVHIREEQGRINIKLPPQGASLEEIERCMIIEALARNGGNITQAARFLKVGRGTLRYKMKKYEIDYSEIKKNSKNGRFEPLCVT